MNMIKVKEMSELEMHKYGVIFQCVFDLFNDFEGVYFKIEVNGQEKILQRKDNLCVLYTLEDEKTVSYEMFSLDEEYNVSQAVFDDYELTMYGDLFTVQERNSSIVQSLKLYKRTDGVDNDGYDGLIIFVQYDIKKKTRITLTYQQIFDKENSIYYYAKERMPLQVVIEYGVFVNDEVGYTLTAMNEYGLLNVLKNGSYNLLREDRTVRYVKSLFIDFKGNYRDAWPFANLLKAEEIESLIKKYNFNTRIPDFIISLYNGENKDVLLIQEIVEKVRLLENELLQPENSRMCLTLKFEEG